MEELTNPGLMGLESVSKPRELSLQELRQRYVVKQRIEVSPPILSANPPMSSETALMIDRQVISAVDVSRGHQAQIKTGSAPPSQPPATVQKSTE